MTAIPTRAYTKAVTKKKRALRTRAYDFYPSLMKDMMSVPLRARDSRSRNCRSLNTPRHRRDDYQQDSYSGFYSNAAKTIAETTAVKTVDVATVSISLKALKKRKPRAQKRSSMLQKNSLNPKMKIRVLLKGSRTVVA